MTSPLFFWDLLRTQLKNLVSVGVLLTFWVGAIFFLSLNVLLIPWYRLWRWVGIWNLVALRFVMRMRNLIDTSATVPTPDPRRLGWKPSYRYQRSPEGRFNDLESPLMGSERTRFGRNFPLTTLRVDRQNLLNPNPRDVSRQLLRRDRFRPATSLNLLAGAWIQFQVHDWMNHKRSREYLQDIPLKRDDPWPADPDNPCSASTIPPGGKMRIRRTLPDTDYPGDPDSSDPPMFCNTETHWWDGSQLYGSTLERQRGLRELQGGRLRVIRIGDYWRLPQNTDQVMSGVDLTGFNDNYWTGLSLFHTLFALEHNAICKQLQKAYPDWDDDRLFETARLINVALMVKIHTIEWTPAILAHPTLLLGMRANWQGIRLLRSIGKSPILGALQEELSGIPGSPQDHDAAPYCLTEEFVSVYRMHPLIPDDYRIYRVESDELCGERTFNEIQGNETRPFIDGIRMEDLFYSFGVSHPGALILHNFPRALQQFHRLKDENGPPGGEYLDLAAVDIMRDRERAVPRYNQFRKLLLLLPTFSYRRLVGLPLFPWFTGLTNREWKERKQWADELQQLYPRRELLDLMVGLYAEYPPKGFGLSDTAFRIFILMASRRLKSDRFFTDDFKPEVYTELGMQWIEKNGFKSVLERHYPALAAPLAEVDNPFSPWPRVEQPPPGPFHATPFTFSFQPIGAGAAFGGVLGSAVNIVSQWRQGVETLTALINSALWGAAIGGAVGGACVTALNVWSDWVEGKLTTKGRVATAYLTAFLFVVGAAVLSAVRTPVRSTGGFTLHDLFTSLSATDLVMATGLGGVLGLALVAVLDLTRLRQTGKLGERLLVFMKLRGLWAVIGALVGWVVGGLVFFITQDGAGERVAGSMSTSWSWRSVVTAGFTTLLTHEAVWGAAAGLGIGAAGAMLGAGEGAVLGWGIGALISLTGGSLTVPLATASSAAHHWEAGVGAAIGFLIGLANRGVISGIRGAIAGWLVGTFVSLLWIVTVAWPTVKHSLITDHALHGAGIGAFLGTLAWLIWPLFRWSIRKHIWNGIAWGKFVLNKPIRIDYPESTSQQITAVPLSRIFRELMNSNIQVAGIIPRDEKSWSLTGYPMKRAVFPFLWWLERIFPSMQPELPPIAQDPVAALSQAYRGLRKRQFDPPEIPPELEGSPDLGGLAVRGPYACYTRRITQGEIAGGYEYEWNLLELDQYDAETDYHPGVYKLGVRVLFQVVPDGNGRTRLRTDQIQSACGLSRPNDLTWQLAKKLVLCALANHLSLVRHWNWVHLTPTGHLAIATRNQLPPDHPLCRLLWPHIFGTQQSNYFGTMAHMLNGGDFADIFSFTFDGVRRLLERTYAQYRFIVTDPYEDDRDRGMGSAPFEKPTQNNLVKLFTVMQKHATRFVGQYYQNNDANVQQDQNVKSWLDELNRLIPSEGTGITPSLLTCATLANLIARFIYLVTVQHQMVGALLWNYQLWSHRQPVRVYRDGRREPLDVYQRLVNYNYLLNVKRTPLIPESGDYSFLAEGLAQRDRKIVADCFRKFKEDLLALQVEMESEPWAPWKIYPKDLDAHINA